MDNDYSSRVPAMVSDILASEARLTALLMKLSTGAVITTPAPGADTTSTGTTPTTTPTSTGATTPTSTAPVVSPEDALTAKYFPANIGLAVAPSPEDSKILRLGDAIMGRPYLLDSTGAVHQLVKSDAGHPNGYTVNGNSTRGGGNEEPFNELLVRQGKVFAMRSTGQWQQFNPAMGSMYNASLPSAFAAQAPGSTGPQVSASDVKAPVMPAPQSPAPGTSGKTLEVGPGKTFKTITAAITASAPGDTIAVDAGTYAEAPPAITHPLYLKAVGGQAVVDCAGLTGSLAYQKGCFVPCADTVIEGFKIVNVAQDQEGPNLTCGVRPDTGCGYLTLKNVEIAKCQDGFGSGTDPVKVVIDGGWFHDNGLPVGNSGRGYTHNIYAGSGTSLTLKNGFKSTTPDGGHAVKSRGWELNVSGGSYDAFEAAVFDIPQGTVSQAVIDGATITKPAGAYNHAVIDYASENNDSGNGGLLITNSTLQLNCDNPFFNVGGGSAVTLDKTTKLNGTAPTVQGGTVVGL